MSAQLSRRRVPKLIEMATVATVMLAALPSQAASPAITSPGADDAAPVAPQTQWQSSGVLGFTDGIGHSSNLLGDLWGLRPLLSNAGITLNIQETSEIIGNVSGGVRRSAGYDGLTQMALLLDTQRAFGWHGGTFNVSAEQLHGTNLGTGNNMATLLPPSGINGDRATRLWELWYQQKFLEDDRLDIKLGQQSLDQEFLVNPSAAVFVNTGFGWPTLPSLNLPGGGPAYPLSALGARIRVRATDSITLLAGIFNGNPAPNTLGDSQQANPSGTSFPLNGGALYIAEIQYAFPSLGTLISPDEGEPLSRTYKLGFYYNTQNFADQRYGTDGLSLANSASNGIPAQHRGNVAVYATADQMLWRNPDDPDRNINLFARLVATPLGSRNLIKTSANLGLTMHEPFLHRDEDTMGLGLGYASVSRQASAYAADVASFGGTYNPKRSSETFIEATYQYQVTPWFQLQPDIQYVFNPGAGLPNPNAPTKRIKDELILGVRTNILF